MERQTIVLSGTGPRLKIKSESNSSKVLVISNGSAKIVNIKKSTDFKFAA